LIRSAHPDQDFKSETCLSRDMIKLWKSAKARSIEESYKKSLLDLNPDADDF